MVRVRAGEDALGCLYNFKLRGHVYAYQSGFDYERAGPHGKPGLTCDLLAIEHALAADDRVYDFLAGSARYKLSLANAIVPLFWAELAPAGRVFGSAVRLLGALRRLVRR